MPDSFYTNLSIILYTRGMNMKFTRILIAALAVLFTIVLITPVYASQPIGGNQGWITMNCNVNGAQVYFDGTYQGEITAGVLSVGVYSTGTPFKSYTVSKNGYTSATGSIPYMPGSGQTENLYATLNPVAPTNAPVGGDMGQIVMHANVNDAQVYFDNTYEGVIKGGVLSVGVYSTGTPLKTYTLSKNGYTSATGSIPYMPGNGKTEDLYATLNPLAPATPATPAQPIGGNQGWYAVNCNVNGATVMFDNTVVGTITQGVLTVPIYTTGTPYQTYTVSMPGYLPYTAPMPSIPAPGQTVTLYATLNPAPTTAPAPVPTKSPLPVWIVLTGIGAIGILAVRKLRN
jgi:hypothetical protein